MDKAKQPGEYMMEGFYEGMRYEELQVDDFNVPLDELLEEAGVELEDYDDAAA